MERHDQSSRVVAAQCRGTPGYAGFGGSAPPAVPAATPALATGPPSAVYTVFASSADRSQCISTSASSLTRRMEFAATSLRRNILNRTK
jgi:hypothetical protein